MQLGRAAAAQARGVASLARAWPPAHLQGAGGGGLSAARPAASRALASNSLPLIFRQQHSLLRAAAQAGVVAEPLPAAVAAAQQQQPAEGERPQAPSPYAVVNFYHLVDIKWPHEVIAQHKAFMEGRDIRGRIYISEQVSCRPTARGCARCRAACCRGPGLAALPGGRPGSRTSCYYYCYWGSRGSEAQPPLLFVHMAAAGVTLVLAGHAGHQRTVRRAVRGCGGLCRVAGGDAAPLQGGLDQGGGAGAQAGLCSRGVEWKWNQPPPTAAAAQRMLRSLTAGTPLHSTINLRCTPPTAQGLHYTIFPVPEYMHPKLRLKYRPNLISLAGGMLGLPMTDPAARATPVPPVEWRRMLAEARTAAVKPIVLDVRNDYEWDAGHFEGAERPVEVRCCSGPALLLQHPGHRQLFMPLSPLPHRPQPRSSPPAVSPLPHRPQPCPSPPTPPASGRTSSTRRPLRCCPPRSPLTSRPPTLPPPS